MASGFYVYELVDPRDGAVFYVGKGKGKRIEAHEREARARVTHPKHERIREIWAAGLKVSRRIVRHFKTDAAAYRFERKLIAKYGQAALCNIHSGGPIEFAPKTEAQKDAALLRAMGVIGAKTAWFRVESARWRYGGEWHVLPREAIEAFARKFKELVGKHGVRWAERTLAAA